MPQIHVRWADNTNELRQRLREGLGAIDAMRSAVDKTVQSMGGQGLFRAAHNVTAAIIEMGGATKLTTAEQTRHVALLEKAIEKYRVMGQTAPPAMREIAAEMRRLADASGFMEKHAVGATNFMQKYSVAATPAVAVTKDLSGAMGLATKALGAFGIGLGVGAVANFGKAILADADALVKMSDKTGISLQGLQKFQIAADDAGNTIDQLTMATNQMQNRLAGNDASAVAAVQKLGLSLDDLKRMAPDQQFMAIADAIRGIQDPAEQVNVAMDIFGRSGAEILPTIKRGFDDVKDSAVGMSDETVKALDDVGDAWDRLVRETKANVGGLIAAILPPLERAWFLANILAGRGGTPLRELQGGSLPRPAGSPNFGTAPAIQPIEPPPNLATAEMFLARMTRTKTAAREAVTAIDQVAAAEAKAAEKMHDLAWGTRDTAKAMSDLGKVGVQHVGMIDDELGSALLKMQAFTAIDTSKFKFDLGALFDMGTVKPPSMSDLKPVAIGLTTGLAEQFKTALPQAIIQSFAGGGSPVKAVGSLFGAQIGTNLVSKVGSSITGLLGKTVGGAVNAILPGIGSLIGPGLSALIGRIKKLFGGPSAEELKSRSESANFQAQIASMLTAQQKLESGGVAWKMTMIGVRDAYLATGRSAAEAERVTAALFDTKNPEAYKRAIEEINGVLDEQKQDRQDLQAAIQRYGFTIDQLGPAMRKQQLGEQAKSLLNDWRLLVGSGIDLKLVNDKMAASVNEYLQVAKRTGTEVPAAMKPILQSLIDQGLLLDADGNKITELGAAGLTFSETMTAGFDRVVAKLNELLRGLGLIPQALDAIPTDRTINVRLNYDDPGPRIGGGPFDRGGEAYASLGGRITPYGMQHLALGGIIQSLRPPQYLGVGGMVGMSSLYGPRGTDTVPLWGTPGEEVVTEQGQGIVKAALASGQHSAAILAELRMQTAILARTREMVVQMDNREIARATVKAWDNGTSLTEAREVLGVP